jgi:hypothetical protein
MAELQKFLGAAAGSAVQITLQGKPGAQGAIVQYITLPGNQPNSNGNHIYVWQTTQNIVPWGNTPDGDTPVASNSATSTQLAKFPFQQKGYIVGYAVAPTPKAVCATIYMPANEQDNPKAWEYANVDLSVVYVGTNFIQLQYTGLVGYTPQTNKNWVGLWLGGQVPWSGDPIKSLKVTPDQPPSGYLYMDGIDLLIGYQYSVGYFMVDQATGRTSLAASATFTVAAS